MKAMAKHRAHSIEFKRQIAQDFIAGETLHALANRHDISRNLIRIWVRKFEAGAFDDAPRRLICFRTTRQRSRRWSVWSDGRPSKSSFYLKNAPRPRSASTSVITGPVVSPS